MKKLLSIILAAALLVGIFAVPVYADNVADDPDYVDTDAYEGRYESEYSGGLDDLYFSKLRSQPEYGSNNLVLAEDDYLDIVPYLKELAYHYNEEGEIDWLLFECSSWLYDEENVAFNFFCGRFCYFGVTYRGPFFYGYGVYDVDLGRFIAIEKAAKKERYEDLGELMAEANLGMLIGDANNDNVVDIIDATLIQKYLTGDENWPEYSIDWRLRAYCEIYGVCDMNRDNSRDVNDVTAVQKCIAKLDYLA